MIWCPSRNCWTNRRAAIRLSATFFSERPAGSGPHLWAGGAVDLIAADEPMSGDQHRIRENASNTGTSFWDAAWPIFAGKAGVLRLGFPEN